MRDFVITGDISLVYRYHVKQYSINSVSYWITQKQKAILLVSCMALHNILESFSKQDANVNENAIT